MSLNHMGININDKWYELWFLSILIVSYFPKDLGYWTDRLIGWCGVCVRFIVELLHHLTPYFFWLLSLGNNNPQCTWRAKYVQILTHEHYELVNVSPPSVYVRLTRLWLCLHLTPYEPFYNLTFSERQSHQSLSMPFFWPKPFTTNRALYQYIEIYRNSIW